MRFKEFCPEPLSEAPRTFTPQMTPLQQLVSDYSYFISFGTVHLDKQATTPEGQKQLLSLVQRLQKDSKSFNGLDKQKMEANRDTILNHIHQMMQYAIPILKKYLPADSWEAKRSQINGVLTAYNNARQINEAMPQWAKKLGAAATLGIAATTGYQGLKDPGGTTKSMDQIERELDAATPKIKADPQVVNQMNSLLNTEMGRALTSEARAAGMKGRELAQFLAQCAHESLNFSTLREIGGRLDHKQYDIQHNPEKARRLGNTEPGDGFKYIGRGFIQLTGKDNYMRAGKALGLPLVEQPELAERPDIAAKIAVWFWKKRVHPRVNDYSNTRSVTRPINSGLAGLEDRDEKYKAVAQILGVLNWPNNKA